MWKTPTDDQLGKHRTDSAMLPMSLALEKTGASNLISEKLVSGLGDYGPLVLMAGIYFTTSLLTMFISNTATAVLVAPIALQSAWQSGSVPTRSCWP